LRLGIKLLLINQNSQNKINNKKNVLIYGAGDAGRQLVIALENSPEFYVVGFLDDNKQLYRQFLIGKTVYPAEKLKEIALKKM